MNNYSIGKASIWLFPELVAHLSTTPLKIKELELTQSDFLRGIKDFQFSDSLEKSLRTIDYKIKWSFETNDDFDSFLSMIKYFNRIWEVNVYFQADIKPFLVPEFPSDVDLILDADWKHITFKNTISYYKFKEEYYRIYAQELAISLWKYDK